MKPLDILLDTDVGGDCDDMMALAYLVYAARYRDVRIKAVTHSQGCENGASLIHLCFRHLNEPIPPVGTAVSPARTYDYYCKSVLERFAVAEDFVPCSDAVTVLRKALADSEQAVLCAIGPMRNLATLLDSKGDNISPLDGKALLKERCAKVVLMAGDFREGAEREWNVLADVLAAQRFVSECPVPIVFLPFDTGVNMYTGSGLVKKYGRETPLTLSFYLYAKLVNTMDLSRGRDSWDPASLLYAVEGCGEHFFESDPGTVTVDDIGNTHIAYHEDGLHRILHIKPHNGVTEQECKDIIGAYIDACVEQIYHV